MKKVIILLVLTLGLWACGSQQIAIPEEATSEQAYLMEKFGLNFNEAIAVSDAVKSRNQSNITRMKVEDISNIRRTSVAGRRVLELNMGRNKMMVNLD